MRNLMNANDRGSTSLLRHDDEGETPEQVIAHFFGLYKLHDASELLWEWLVEVMVSDATADLGRKYRMDQIFFYEQLQRLLEASFLLLQQKNNDEKTSE